MEFLPPAFEALKNVNQFIIYKLVPSKLRTGKTDKIPLHFRTGSPVNPLDATNWTNAENAILSAKLFGEQHGVGLVLTKDDPYWFLDIDNCLDTISNNWNDIAIQLLTVFAGAAVEISSSKQGLHILGSGTALSHSCKNAAFSLEFYTQDRFIALTGINATGNINQDFSNMLPWLIGSYFPQEQTIDLAEWTSEPHEKWNGDADNAQLINRALRSVSARSTFGGAASFKDLWDANGDVLAQTYPDTFRDRQYDESAADAALAQHLAFWTGNNCDRMLELMQQSKLAREKWEREDYLRRTILSACSRQREFLQDKKPQEIKLPVADISPAEGSMITGATFLSFEQQLQFFKGCVYVRDQHKVLVPGGDLLRPDQFRTAFGGFSFPVDAVNERVTRNAWEAFTESQVIQWPRADSSCFKPQYEPATLVKESGRALVNLWWPITIPRLRGDATLFLQHLEKVLPDKRDQLILLSYMAACVQHKGIKFQWAPLIQGVEGNGKTLFTWVTAFAIGHPYVFYPKADQIGKNFNKWMYGKLLIGIEDVYAADSRNEIIEALKPMVTNERIAIEPKGVDVMTLEVCCNFIINSNHKDGLRKTQNDRRFAPLFTAQQNKSDLIRDGMTSDYFSNLWNWLQKDNGYAIVAELLHTFEIPSGEFNPANKQIAPVTSSTENAIHEGLGTIEQEILEAVEQGIIGFRGGWVSSMALDKLLERLRANHRISHNRRREILQSLNYILHPGLNKGRVNNTILPDGGKPRLYIARGHVLETLRTVSEIERAYTLAQN